MIIRKFTNGTVEQVYDTDTGKFISQRFVADDHHLEVEDADTGDKVVFNLSDFKEYLPFDMVHP